MSFPKYLAPVVTLLLLASLAVGGFLFYTNSGGSSTRIAQVTPIPAKTTTPIISPVAVITAPATDVQIDDQALSTTNSPLDGPVVANAVQPESMSNISAPHGIPTPLPASEDMVRGEALAHMQEIDRTWDVVAPDPQTIDEALKIELEEEVVRLYLDDFFKAAFDPFTGTPPTMTDKLLSLDGRQVELRGYMAPPLKLGLDWFLLGDLPVGVCPFHATVESITSGSALIYVDGSEFPFSSEPLKVVGELHIGELADPETGMVSIARIYTTADDINVLTLAGP